MIERIKKIFKEFNLTENDAKLYLKALEIGPSTVSKLATLLKMDQSSAYKSFGRLEYCGFFEKEAGKEYAKKVVAKDPRRVYESFFKKKVNLLRRRELEFKDLLSELLAVYKEENKPRVRFFEGKEGFLEIQSDTLSGQEKEVLCFGNPLSWYELFGLDYDKLYISTRLQRGIRFKMLVFKDRFTFELPQRDKQENRETKFLNQEVFDFSGMMFIYGNKVVLLTPTKENFGLIIESYHLSAMMKDIFEYIWTQS